MMDTSAGRVLRFIREKGLVEGGTELIVAVSGGPDSVCLLYLLYQLAEELNITLHVAHLDHGLRGAESEADARYVADLAKSLGLPATVEKRDVAAYRTSHRMSLEEAARAVRYQFLGDVAASVGANQVAVGHTSDDHIETVLMHLLRGSGTRGLCGLRPENRGPFGAVGLTIVRPLLVLSRADTLACCRESGLEPRQDASNLSLSPFRNRIRLQLLPRLQAYNPRIREALQRTARIATEDITFQDEATRPVWDTIVTRQGDSLVLDKVGLRVLPAALKRNLLRLAIEDRLGNLKDIEAHHIERLLAALDKPAGRHITLPDGLVFTVDYERYVLSIGMSGLSPFPELAGATPLQIPGQTEAPGWLINASLIEPSAAAEPEGISECDSGFTAYFDFDRTGADLALRPRRPGDRFQPLGLPGGKKVGAFMIDARVPRAWRGKIPIVASPEQIVWLAGYRIDERVKVTENTRRVLRLRLEKRGGGEYPGASGTDC